MQSVLDLPLKTIQMTQGTIRYIDAGQGPPILFIHGAPVTGMGFYRLMDLLQDGYRVIAPDLPGFGQSTKTSTQVSLAEYSRFIVDFCMKLELKNFYLFANDSGWCIAMHAAASLADSIRGLIVTGTVPLPLTGRAWFVKLFLRYVITSYPLKLINRRFNLIPRAVASIAPKKKPFPMEIRQKMIASFDTKEKRDLVLDLFRQMATDHHFIEKSVSMARAYLQAKPALIIFGSHDPMRFAGGLTRYKKLFPNHQALLLKGEAHFPMFTSSELMSQAIKPFIQEIEASSTPEIGGM